MDTVEDFNYDLEVALTTIQLKKEIAVENVNQNWLEKCTTKIAEKGGSSCGNCSARWYFWSKFDKKNRNDKKIVFCSEFRRC